MKLKITTDQIRRGKPNDPEACPVALAFKDTGLFGTDIRVNGAKCEFRDYPLERVDASAREDVLAGEPVLCYLSPSVQARIEHYDKTGEMKPFAIDIDERAQWRPVHKSPLDYHYERAA